MRDRPIIDPRVVPIGMYAGNPPLPMTPSVVLVDQLLDSMAGPAGVRLSASTNRGGRYFGTDVIPAPVYPRGRVNRQADLEVAPIAATQRTAPVVL